MSREIRISIDDDEVFERLKRRKRELDLSWEEALRRGLERVRYESGSPRRSDHSSHSPHSSHVGHSSHSHRSSHSRHSPRSPNSGQERPSPFDPDFGERLRQEIESSVQESMHAVEESIHGIHSGLDVEINQLEDAEDAMLSFPFLDDEQARVPLRVNLESSADGLSVEVVAVRRGKDTATSNRFADDQRAQVNRRLAQGETVRLELQNGTETYDVIPALSWGRADDGTPTVTDVSVTDVQFS